MTTILGTIEISDSLRPFASQEGQRAIFDAVRQWLEQRNQELNAALAALVEETTSDHQRRYLAPGSGYLQRRAEDGSFAAVKTAGHWDVAFPLQDYGAQIAGNDVALRYMTAREFESHIEGVFTQNVNTVRYEALRALFNSSNWTFADPLWGSLTVRPLANDDGTVYPPVIGSDTSDEENHYLTLGAASISDTSDPFPTLRDEILEHTGIGDVVAWISPDEESDVRHLSNFLPAYDGYIEPGTANARPTNIPQGLPGVVIGRHTSGVWIASWAYIPSGYILAIDRLTRPPLIKRVDPPDTGLGQDLQLVTRNEQFPFESAFYRHRFGFGCGNRLAGAVMQITAESSYTTPAYFE